MATALRCGITSDIAYFALRYYNKRPGGFSPGASASASRPFRLSYPAKSVHVVSEISLAVGLRVITSPSAPKTDPARSARLAVLHACNELPGTGTPAAVEIARDASVGIVNVERTGPTPGAIGPLSAFGDFPADVDERPRLSEGFRAILEPFLRYVLDGLHFDSPVVIR